MKTLASRHSRITCCAAATIVLIIIAPSFAAGNFHLSVGKAFTSQLDLEAFRLVAVQDQGRIKTFDSLAREKLKYLNSRLVGRVDPAVLYLDMLLTPEYYAGVGFIHIKNKLLAQRLVQGVRSLIMARDRQGVIADQELKAIQRGGFVSLSFLDHPAVRSVLSELERDLRRSGKAVRELRSARHLADSHTLRAMLTVVPPPGGAPLDSWYNLDAAISGQGRLPRDHSHAGMGDSAVPGLDSVVAVRLSTSWATLAEAWRFQRADEASAALNELARTLADIEPGLYPQSSRLNLELWYYKHNKLTAGWLLYFFALPVLLIAFVYGDLWARWVGLGFFGVAFTVHTLSLIIRWWLAGRIPNANLFEAIIASAWFGCVCAIVLELAFRNKRLRYLPALCGSAYAMLAMMFGNFMTVTLNSDITTVMPVLDRTIWLYIHTNVIIASYALVAFAAFTSTGYLIGRFLAKVMPERFGADWKVTAIARGGASSVILNRGHGKESSMARTLDGATMIFLEVAFVSLWVGTILGAVWADVSWGRPWGWDPKEVFALNTWLVFLVLLHLRMKVRDKGLWTAVLAVIGFAVMVFNWVAVNLVIVGLHSYA